MIGSLIHAQRSIATSLLLLGCIGAGPASGPADGFKSGNQPQAPTIGEAAPPVKFDAVLKPPEYTTAQLPSLSDKVVVIAFWSPLQPASLAVLPHIKKLLDDFEEESSAVFILAVRGSEEVVRTRIRSTSLSAWVGIDASSAMMRAYAAEARPFVVLIDRQGRLAAICDVERATDAVIRELLNHRVVSLPRTHAVRDPAEIDAPLPFVDIQESNSSPLSFRQELDTSDCRISGDAIPLDGLICTAFETDPSRLDASVKDTGKRYRFVVQAAKGQEVSIFPLLQAAVRKKFGLRIKWGREKLACLELRRIVGAAEPLPALTEADDPTGEGRSKPETFVMGPKGKSRLRHATNGDTPFWGHSGGPRIVWSGFGLTMGSFAKVVERTIAVPVFDETGMEGRFNLLIQFDANEPGGMDAAFKDVGLQLVEVDKRVRRLHVEAKKR